MQFSKQILMALRRFAGAKSGTQPPPLPSALGAFVPGPTPPPLHIKPQSLPKRLWARASWKWRVAVGVPLAAVAAAVPTLAFLMVYYTVSFPHPLAMRAKERAPIIRILARDGAVLAERGAAHDYMPLDLLPRHVVGAVVAIEDRRFFDHTGLDPWGFARAVFANLRAGRLAQGGSTLTQQLAKNLFLSSERTFSRKIEELALALWLELRLSKSDILELYLNRVYFGAGAYGIEAASQRYFDKSARELSISEAALIAGLLKAPSKFSPLVSPALATSRGRVVLSKMAETGFITQAQYDRALSEKIGFAKAEEQKDQFNGADYAVDLVLENLPPIIGSGHGEIVVETTLDAALQKQASDIVARALTRQGEQLDVSQAALVLLDTDGGIRALVGGRNYAGSQFNRATKARRQPGSAFKPFVYLAALERGMRPETVTYDLPLSIDGWAPRNDNGEYVGQITLRHALAQSVNTVAVRLNQDVGRGATAAMAQRLGIKSELRNDPTLALGTSEVSLLELTGAYSVLSNGGTSVIPHAIRRVRMSSGRVIFAREGGSQVQLVEPMIAGEMSSMLNTAMMSGTGRRAAIAAHPAAGKTGTSQEFRDAWFIGYTAHLTAGVWIGNDNGKPMQRATGGGLPAEIWREVMTAAHAGKAPLALPGTTYRPQSAPDAVAATQPSAHETLPWVGTPAPQPATRIENAQSIPQPAAPAPRSERKLAVKKVAPKVAPVKREQPDADYPASGISEDFIAKALAETDATPPPAQLAEETAIPKERPKGIMSLGAWW
jgi:penicillin-binding protein 1A